MKCKFSMNTSPKRRLARNELPYIYCACAPDGTRCPTVAAMPAQISHGGARCASPRGAGNAATRHTFHAAAQAKATQATATQATATQRKPRQRKLRQCKPRQRKATATQATATQATAAQATATQSHGNAKPRLPKRCFARDGARKKGERSNGRSHFRSPCSQKG